MFEYIKDAYREIKDYYHTYSYSSDPSRRKNRAWAFFKSIFSYFFARPKPFILSNEQRTRFEKGLDNRLVSNYDICYGPGEITLKRKDLTRQLY